MPLLDELANAAPSGMSADLRAGIQQLSADQQFTFTLYQRLILPADGFVFYAPASTVSPPITTRAVNARHCRFLTSTPMLPAIRSIARKPRLCGVN